MLYHLFKLEIKLLLEFDAGAINKGDDYMKNFTEVTKQGDPMLRIKMPKAIHQAIAGAAKINKRRPQDELIKRLFLSFKAGEELQVIQSQLLPQLKEIYQS